MKNIKLFSDGMSLENIFWSLAFIAAAIVVWVVVSRFRETVFKKIEETKQNVVRRKAMVSTISNGIKILLIVFTILVVLQINGVNVSSVIAGLGIASALTALAVQDVVKDLVQGLRIMTDGYFAVGDTIRYNDSDYQVIEFSIRTTKMKSIVDQSIVTTGNRNITEVTRLNGFEIIKIPVSYDVTTEEADAVFEICKEKINEIKGITKCKYKGLNEFADSAIIYLMTFSCKPTERYDMRRAALKIIRNEMMNAGLEIPYQQIDIHQT